MITIQRPTGKPAILSRTNITSGDLGCKAEHGVMHKKPCDDTSHDAEDQSPMEVCSRNDADHIGLSDMMRRGMEGWLRLSGSRKVLVTRWFNNAIAI